MAPPAPFLAPEHHGKPVVMLLPCWSGDLDEGELALEPARTFGRPLADAVARRNWLTWQGFFDASFGPGAQNYWKSHDFTALHDQVIDATLEAGRHLPDPQCNLPLAQLGGAISRVANDATAYGRRDAEWLINIHARTFDPRKVPEVVAWARDLFRATEPYATGGVYVNFMTEDEAERAPGAFGPNYARLVELKRKWDPTNLFRVNVNIRAVVAA